MYKETLEENLKEKQNQGNIKEYQLCTGHEERYP